MSFLFVVMLGLRSFSPVKELARRIVSRMTYNVSSRMCYHYCRQMRKCFSWNCNVVEQFVYCCAILKLSSH